jgi:hypothetical protein
MDTTNEDLLAKARHLNSLLPTQHQVYYQTLGDVTRIPIVARKECIVFIEVAAKTISYLSESVEQNQFILENAEELQQDTGSGHESLNEMIGTMEEHLEAAKALREALGVWLRGEQARIDVLRANMETARKAEMPNGA